MATEFDALRDRIRKNIDRTEKSLSELKAQLTAIDRMEALSNQQKLELATPLGKGK